MTLIRAPVWDDSSIVNRNGDVAGRAPAVGWVSNGFGIDGLHSSEV
jgi:hypothetical protein